MIRFGTRGSKLAVTQTRLVADDLKRRTGEDYVVEIIETRGDKNLNQPLPEIGGKGLFTQELEDALRDGRIDVAVHSLKDLPVEDPDGLTIGAIPPRASPHDVLVFDPAARDPEGGTVPLALSSVVGTSSPRRASSLLALRRDLSIADIRGNVETRARKVADGEYHATILAAAGLHRLGLDTPDLVRCDLPVELFTPAPGQGALGIQCRRDDRRTLDALATVHDPVTAACVEAEREVLSTLGGGCSMPLGVFVRPDADASFRMLVSLFSEIHKECGVNLDLSGDDPHVLATTAAERLAPLLGNPLAGQRVALLRPGGAGTGLQKGLAVAGAEVDTVTVSEILPLPDNANALDEDQLRTIAFTSARAVDRFFEQVVAYDLDLIRSRLFAIGPATAQAIDQRGHQCETPANPSGGRALAELVIANAGHDHTVLFPCAQDRHTEFESRLQAAGIAVLPLPVYRTEIFAGIEIPDADYLVFTSPSAVQACTTASLPNPRPHLVAIGHATASAMESAGFPPHAVLDTPTVEALVRFIRGLCHEDSPETTAPHASDA